MTTSNNHFDKVGQTFEHRGRLYRVHEVIRIAGNLYNAAAYRVNKRTGSTFGREVNFPFTKS